ncbi:bacteriocin [Alteromonas sediminis]|uniref:Bacteriocin n=1 Tax=Alteromonas sediminis TaxID=2259342 RepID=A0A3N5ZEJ9_9ALTE|nr:bacteriocin [Alteromonas sediminis]
MITEITTEEMEHVSGGLLEPNCNRHCYR